MSGGPGVLVDRDGTLIRDVGYLSRIEQIELLPRAAEAIRLLRAHGLKVAVVTNQSAVGRGLLDEKELGNIHREIEKRLAADGAAVDGIYYCPHHPTEALGSYRVRCDCRKPDIGLARRAAAELNLDLKRSYVIGDKETDMELAVGSGARGILLAAGAQTSSSAYAAASDILEAARRIVRDLSAED
jgi:D-glycero-D-manno-heptose 1,7-bisphosphate phosphatase